MNKKLKTILCIAILFFCTFASLHAQERYLSQVDIDAFIAILVSILNDDVFNNLDDLNFEELPTAKEFSEALKKNKWLFSNALKKYGMNSDYPIETFYTILVGSTVQVIEAEMEVLVLQAKTKDERKILQDEILDSFEFTELINLKDSIHPDDLSLLITNFRFLNVLLYGSY